MKKLTSNSLTLILGTFSLLLCLSANHANATLQWYWDINGTAAGSGGASPSGSWEGANWTSLGSTGLLATGAYTDGTSANGGSFPRFAASSDATGNYTVTVTGTHHMVGLFQRTGTASTLTISGAGTLIIDTYGGSDPNGHGGGAGPQQGFLSSGSEVVNVNVKLSGPGGVQSNNGGQISLFNSGNDYSGGTAINAALINYNNNNSFGSGIIYLGSSGNGSAAVATVDNLNIANTWSNTTANFSVNLAGPVGATTTFSGPWLLGPRTMLLGTGNDVTRTVIISGIISGTAGLGRQNSTTHGTLWLQGANTYSGKTSIQSSITRVSSINRITSPLASSNLGRPTTVANGTIAFGTSTFTGTLLYDGPGETTDRVVDLASASTGGGTIISDGTGPLTFTSATTASSQSGVHAKTLTLQGSYVGSDNVFSGAITGDFVALTKNGTGTWLLSGNNTYGGPTTDSGGEYSRSATLTAWVLAASTERRSRPPPLPAAPRLT